MNLKRYDFYELIFLHVKNNIENYEMKTELQI